MSFICKRCNNESNKKTERKLICADCNKDLDLLYKEFNVNSERIKKLEEHKKSIEPDIKNPRPEKDLNTILETMKRLERNLKIEYEKRDQITNALKS